MSDKYYRWVNSPDYVGWVDYHTGDRYNPPNIAHVRIGIAEPSAPLGWSTCCIAVFVDPTQPPLLFDSVTLQQYDWTNHFAGDIHNRPVQPFKWLRFIDHVDVHVGMIQSIAGYWHDGPVRSGTVVNAAETLLEKIDEIRKKGVAGDTIKHGPVLQEDISDSSKKV